MSFVLLTLAILLAILIVLLILPITVVFRIDRFKEIRGHVIFQWFFGLLRFRIGIPGAARVEQQYKRKLKGKTRKRKQFANVHNVIALLKQSAFRRRVIRFIKGVLRATHARDLYLRLRIGLGDPADTGRLWGLLGPIAGIATTLHSTEVRIEPEFMAPVLEIESHGEFRLIPLQFIVLATAFVVSPTTIHAWRTLRRSNA